MDDLDRIRAVLNRKNPAPAAELAELLPVARSAHEAAKTKASQERLLHPKHVLAGGEGAAKHRQLLADLDGQVQEASVVLSALQERHTEAAAAEAEAARVAKYAEAQKLRDEVAAELQAEYPKLAEGMVRLLHRVTYADAAVAAANADRPADHNPLTRVEEGVRDAPALPRRNVSERLVLLWAYPDSGRPLSDKDQQRVQASGAHHGRLQGGTGMYESYSQVVRRAFRRVEYQAAVPSVRGVRIADLKIPALRARDRAYWEPGHFSSPKPADTLRRLNEIISGVDVWQPDGRKILVEYVPTEQTADAEAD